MKDIRKMIERGELVIGTFSFFSNPVPIEVIGYTRSFDFVIIDSEHAPGWVGTQYEDLVRAAYASDITPIARVTELNRSLPLKVLDYGAKGVIFPSINTKEEMLTAMRYVKYPPKGIRGACPAVRAAKYGVTDWADYYKQSLDDLPIVIGLIESKTAMDNIEEIVSVVEKEGDKGVALTVARFDLSVSLGGGGNVRAPAVNEASDKIFKLCKSRGIPVAEFALDVDHARELIEKGADIIIIGVDLINFARLYKDLGEQVNELRGLR
jgi:2-keto-3-deoxy-L-rhamnonate aldolase RhmA